MPFGMFRYKPSIHVSYERQGYIHFVSLHCHELPQKAQKKIRQLCQDVGGDHAPALLEYVTTNAGADAVCKKHFLSCSTLDRAVRRYYEKFPRRLF